MDCIPEMEVEAQQEIRRQDEANQFLASSGLVRSLPFSDLVALAILTLSLEKTHHRSSSNSSAAMQRDEFVAELDNKHVAGIPDHDFTAGSGMAGQGIYQDYNSDPYAHAEAYEYDPTYPYDQPGYDQPTQDTGAGAGYAELQRGNSIGSGSGHGHGQQYAVEQFTMPMPDQYLGRPTGGSDGP
jgi:hypothetical protein